MQRILILNSHPIQYFAPLHRQMAADPEIDLTVLFCSDHGVEGSLDHQFGVRVKWDIPLLENYKYVFLKNNAPNPSIQTGFWGLMNWAVVPYLWKSPRSTLVVYGWGFLSNLLALVFGRLFGHTVCMRCDVPDIREDLYYKVGKKGLRKFVFQYLLFPLVHYFFYVGKQNHAFYKRYGVPERKLIFTPFSVDNQRFSDVFFQQNKTALRRALHLPEGKKVVLFSGKLIPIKRPMDLLTAFQRLQRSDAALVFMGDGELRGEMEVYIEQHGLQNVFITGFVNQSRVADYYGAADVFVMCSELDAWGLSVNEAMNFELPLLLSDRTGCAEDLVKSGQNGFVFLTGDIEDLTKHLRHLLDLPAENRIRMGQHSRKMVQDYCFEKVIEGFKKIN